MAKLKYLAEHFLHTINRNMPVKFKRSKPPSIVNTPLKKTPLKNFKGFRLTLYNISPFSLRVLN